jgi:hypothetical protein
MKPFNYISLLILFVISAFLLSSCGGDDECQPEAWEGTWSTETSCAGTTLDLVLGITAVDENTIRIESNGEEDEIDVDGCAANVVQVLDFLGTEISLSLDMVLNGDIIDLDIEVTALGTTQTCIAALTRS